MAIHINHVDAKRILTDVPDPKQAFWFRNGVIAHNLYELANNIESAPDDIFYYHCNSEKNDFYKWILDVFGDHVLAHQLRNENNKKNFVKKIRARLQDLEHA